MTQLEFKILERVGNAKLKTDKFDFSKYSDIQYLGIHWKQYIKCTSPLMERISFNKLAKTREIKHISTVKRGLSYTVIFEV